MTRPFHNAGLCVDNARTHLQALEYLRLHDLESFREQDGAEDYRRTVASLRCWIISMRDALNHELQQLPLLDAPAPIAQGDPLPESLKAQEA